MSKDGANMNRETMMSRKRIVPLLTLSLLAIIGVQVSAQTPPQTPVDPAQSQTQAQLPDLAPLNLSPDQIQKIRGINAELKDQRQAANQKLRQAQRALAEAVESPTPNETLIDQRSHELADAQLNTIRLRSLAEARILQVMTPEQRVRLREMRQRNQAIRREANRQQQVPGNGLRRRQQGLQRNPNGPGQRKLGPPANKP
jgi:Spy/CpxP family protein refolding chaperone